jgi:predicted RNA-binding Zn-ribbon protein involved in translation (DUF1610 family)
MDKVTNPDRRDVIRSIVYLLTYIIVISVGAFLLLPDLWYLWLALVLAGMVILVNWHKQKTAYRCPNCEHIYEISFLTDLAAPHGFNSEGGWLLLRCPNCRKRSKTRTLKKVE